MQEGRGSGYVAKSRDRMLVQYVEGTDKEITTFEAYHEMGMKKDYRDYRNIRDICYLLGILDKEFVLITNNPDKINGFKEQGMNLSRIETIDIAPSPFNIAYLKSKEESGHLLN
jgi:3,4-dihydroxy 2-butanone 4-phosphate synthase/GTP cyclohydrolase II